MSFLIFILLLFLAFKAAGFLFDLCGAVLGTLISLTGYALLGIFAAAVLGMTLYVLPLLVLAGLGAAVKAVVNG